MGEPQAAATRSSVAETYYVILSSAVGLGKGGAALRGEVLPAYVFGSAEQLNRLLALNAIREASPTESKLPKVTVEIDGPEARSIEARADKQKRDIESLQAQLSEVTQRNLVLMDEIGRLRNLIPDHHRVPSSLASVPPIPPVPVKLDTGIPVISTGHGDAVVAVADAPQTTGIAYLQPLPEDFPMRDVIVKRFGPNVTPSELINTPDSDLSSELQVDKKALKKIRDALTNVR